MNIPIPKKDHQQATFLKYVLIDDLLKIFSAYVTSKLNYNSRILMLRNQTG